MILTVTPVKNLTLLGVESIVAASADDYTKLNDIEQFTAVFTNQKLNNKNLWFNWILKSKSVRRRNTKLP